MSYFFNRRVLPVLNMMKTDFIVLPQVFPQLQILQHYVDMLQVVHLV
jgi:hypothetical protein